MRVVPVIQCNHVDFEGTIDASLRRDNRGHLSIDNVIEKAKALSQHITPVIACPDIQENNIFIEISDKHGIDCYKGSITNVTERLIGAAALRDATHIAWLQGLLYFLDIHLMKQLIDFGLLNGYDYARCQDGSCKHWLGQFISVEALKRLSGLAKAEFKPDEAQRHLARPFAFMRCNPERFRIGMFEPLPPYSDEKLLEMRALSKCLHTVGERAEHTPAGTVVGDVSIGRYKEILELIPSKKHILDIACGTGYGSSLLASRGANVIGVDISHSAIQEAVKKFSDSANFKVGDGISIPLEDSTMDIVVSIATIEHIQDDTVFVKEISRVLKPFGQCIIYTPQNRMGKIPTWPWHEREYSIECLVDLFQNEFTILEIWGWQNGMVTKDDPRGDGTFLICSKKK